MSVTLAQASTIVDAALKKARELKQMAQTVVVLDTGGHSFAPSAKTARELSVLKLPSAKPMARSAWAGARAP